MVVKRVCDRDMRSDQLLAQQIISDMRAIDVLFQRNHLTFKCVKTLEIPKLELENQAYRSLHLATENYSLHQQTWIGAFFCRLQTTLRLAPILLLLL